MESEKEKMLAGAGYDNFDPELIEIYHQARSLLLAYNQSSARDTGEREQIFTALLRKKNKSVWIDAPFFCDYGENIELGENTFINTKCMFLDNN